LKRGVYIWFGDTDHKGTPISSKKREGSERSGNDEKEGSGVNLKRPWEATEYGWGWGGSDAGEEEKIPEQRKNKAKGEGKTNSLSEEKGKGKAESPTRSTYMLA